MGSTEKTMRFNYIIYIAALCPLTERTSFSRFPFLWFWNRKMNFLYLISNRLNESDCDNASLAGECGNFLKSTNSSVLLVPPTAAVIGR